MGQGKVITKSSKTQQLAPPHVLQLESKAGRWWQHLSKQASVEGGQYHQVSCSWVCLHSLCSGRGAHLHQFRIEFQ
jgi:hypothetical protein